MNRPAPWPDLLSRYECVLAAAEDFEEPALLAVERSIRERLRTTPWREQVGIAVRVRGIVRSLDERVLGWTSNADTAHELRALGFLEQVIDESRRLR